MIQQLRYFDVKDIAFVVFSCWYKFCLNIIVGFQKLLLSDFKVLTERFYNAVNCW